MVSCKEPWFFFSAYHQSTTMRKRGIGMAEGGNKSKKEKLWVWLVKTVCKLVITVCFVIIVLPRPAVRSLFDDSVREETNPSTIKRAALPPGSVNETAYFTQDSDLNDPIVIEEGLKHFYEMTGVQPYVLITTSSGRYYTNGPDITQDLNFHRDLVAYTRACYPQLFTDESHLLLVFHDIHSYGYTMEGHDFCIVTGSKAKTVIDGEAEKILSDQIESYFDDLGISEEMFSNAFRDAGDRIMGVKAPQSDITVWIILGALAVLVLLVRLRSIKKKRKLKAQQDMEILKIPLDQYGENTGSKAEMPPRNDGRAPEDPADARDHMTDGVEDPEPVGAAEALAKKYAARGRTASADVKPVSGAAGEMKPSKE
jgi:hypothetical protein